MFSENTLMLYQQGLQLGPYFVKWQMGMDWGFPWFPINYFFEIILKAEIPRVV